MVPGPHGFCYRLEGRFEYQCQSGSMAIPPGEILDCCADSKTPAAAAVTMLTSVDFITVGGTHRRTVEEKNGHCDEFRMSSHMNLLPGIEVVMMGA